MAITMQVLKLLIQCKCARSMGFPSGQFSRVDNLSTSCQWRARKKVSQYRTVDTERYSSLVRKVLSSKTSSQTPASIENENCQLYGPVVRSRPPSQQPKVPKNLHPLLNEAKGQSEYVPGPLARITLQKDSNTHLPSVTRILQKTMPPDQAFYLERWKRRMIAELGEEGFKEYSLSKNIYFLNIKRTTPPNLYVFIYVFICVLDIFRQGRLFHAAIEENFTQETPSKEDPEHPMDVSGYVESVSHVLNDITGVRAIESAVQHSTLQYLGIVDCVAQYR